MGEKQKLSPNEPQVLIVGAGPTGLTLAIELARRKVPFRIIEKKEGPSLHSKAIALQPRTLEVFYNMELSRDLVTQGHPVKHLNGLVDKRHRFNIDFTKGINSFFPYILILPQPITERILLKRLHELGCEVEFETTLLEVAPHGEQNLVILKTQGQTQKFEIPWVVGCDGHQSRVRECLGLQMKGETSPDTLLITDAEVQWKYKEQESYLFLNQGQVMGAFPIRHNLYRFITLGTKEEQSITEPDLALFQKRLNFVCPVPAQLSNPLWLSRFQIHRRIVEQMRVGHIFLAGDAAHLHSPFGGQGLNTGVQDAYNLGWKLALRIYGNVTDSFLDSYHAERHPVAENILKGTNVAMRALLENSVVLRKLRDVIAPNLVEVPFLQARLKAVISELTVNYRTSPIIYKDHELTNKFAFFTDLKAWIQGSVRAGDRAPYAVFLQPQTYKAVHIFELMRGVNHTLFMFLGDEPKKIHYYSGWLDNLIHEFQGILGYLIVGEHSVDYNLIDIKIKNMLFDPDGRAHKSYGYTKPTMCLVRPDGYVAISLSPINEIVLGQYLKNFYVISNKN